MTLMQKDGKPSMISIWKVSPHAGGNQFCLLDLEPDHLLIVNEFWVRAYNLEIVFPINGSIFAHRLEAMQDVLNRKITGNYETEQHLAHFLQECGIQPDPEQPFNIRQLFDHGLTAAWMPYPKTGRTNAGTGSRSADELKANQSPDGMKLREKVALTFDKALMLIGHDTAQRFTWDDLLGVVDILVDFINGNGATDNFNFDLMGMAFAAAKWNGLRDVSNFFDAVKEVAFYNPAPWIGDALNPIAKSLTISTHYIGLDYLLGFLVQYGNKGIKSYWPNGRAALESAIKSNQYHDLLNKLPESKTITRKEQARNIAAIYKALEQTGLQFKDIHQRVMLAALEINEVPVKFEMDLFEPLKFRTPGGGEVQITAKGDITLIKNNKQIEVKDGDTTQTITATGTGVEVENKKDTGAQTSVTDNVSGEFEKAEANIAYDRLFSIVSKDGITSSVGTHLVSVGGKLYARFKHEAPESTLTLPNDPFGNSWSSKMHNWTFTMDFRPGDHEEDHGDGNQKPEAVLKAYYLQLLHERDSEEKLKKNKPKEFERNLYSDSDSILKPNSKSPSSATPDHYRPYEQFFGAFYPYNALAYRGINPARSAKASLSLVALYLSTYFTGGKLNPIIMKFSPELRAELKAVIQEHAPLIKPSPQPAAP